MKYLIRKKGWKNRAHLWIGGDTACRMYSTGGLGRNAKHRYAVHDTPRGRQVCSMCNVSMSDFLGSLPQKETELPETLDAGFASLLAHSGQDESLLPWEDEPGLTFDPPTAKGAA